MLRFILEVLCCVLSWPTVALCVVVAYHRPLCGAIGRLRTIRCPGYFEGTFGPDHGDGKADGSSGDPRGVA